MDVWEYFESRRREISDASLTTDRGFVFAEEAGSGGQRGRVFGRIIISDRAFLQVNERLVVRGTGVHRDEYAYYLIVDEAEAWGYERDPTHPDPVHRHDRDHNRYPCEPVSFKQVLEKAWQSSSYEDSLSDPE